MILEVDVPDKIDGGNDDDEQAVPAGSLLGTQYDMVHDLRRVSP